MSPLYYSVLSATLFDCSLVLFRSLLSFSSKSTMSFICLGVRSTSSIDNSSAICKATHDLSHFTSDKTNKTNCKLKGTEDTSIQSNHRETGMANVKTNSNHCI